MWVLTFSSNKLKLLPKLQTNNPPLTPHSWWKGKTIQMNELERIFFSSEKFFGFFCFVNKSVLARVNTLENIRTWFCKYSFYFTVLSKNINNKRSADLKQFVIRTKLNNGINFKCIINNYLTIFYVCFRVVSNFRINQILD